MNLVPWRSSSLAPLFRSNINIEDELDSFQREVNSLMDKYFYGAGSSMLEPLSFAERLYPAIDLRDEDDKILVEANVPGMSESDIEIDLHNNILTLKGEKKEAKEIRNADYLFVEREEGAFRRDIYLDSEVDENNVRAELRDGVLYVELSKKEFEKTAHKKIPIMH